MQFVFKPFEGENRKKSTSDRMSEHFGHYQSSQTTDGVAVVVVRVTALTCRQLLLWPQKTKVQLGKKCRHNNNNNEGCSNDKCKQFSKKLTSHRTTKITTSEGNKNQELIAFQSDGQPNCWCWLAKKARQTTQKNAAKLAAAPTKKSISAQLDLCNATQLNATLCAACTHRKTENNSIWAIENSQTTIKCTKL